MASVTHRVSTPSTSNASSYASASFTPAAGELLAAFVTASGTTATAPTLVSSTGTTFTLVATALKGASADRVYMFVADNLSTATAQTLTFDCSQDAATGALIQALGVASMTRAGSDAIRQTKVLDNQAAGTPAPAFTSAALTGNVTVGCIGNATSPATMTPPTNWTEGNDNGYSTPTTGGEYVFRNSGFTGTTITWGSASASAYGAIIAEFDTTTPSAPGAPTGLVARDITTVQFSLNWTAPASGPVVGYKIDVATDSGFTSFVTGWNAFDAGNVLTRSINSGLSAGTVYYARVRAYNLAADGSNSSTVLVGTFKSGAPSGGQTEDFEGNVGFTNLYGTGSGRVSGSDSSPITGSYSMLAETTSSYSATYAGLTLPASQTYFDITFKMRGTQPPGTLGRLRISGSTTAWQFVANTAGSAIQFGYWTTGGSLSSSSTGVLWANDTTYTFRVVYDKTAGTIVAYIDGNIVINQTNASTSITPNTLEIGTITGGFASSLYRYDDLSISHTSSTPANVNLTLQSQSQTVNAITPSGTATTTLTVQNETATINAVQAGISATVTLTTQSQSQSQGAVTATGTASVSLVAQTESVSQGAITPSGTATHTLTTQSQSQSQGTLTPSGTATHVLTLQSQTQTLSPLAPSGGANVTLVAQTQAATLGAVTASAGTNADVNLSVQSQSQTLNALTASGDATVTLVDQLESATQGSLTLSATVNLSLTTQTQTQSLGTITPNIDVSPTLTTQSQGQSQGSPTATGTASVTLAVQSEAATQGTVTASGSGSATFPLTTASQPQSQGSLTPSGTATHTLTLLSQSASQGVVAASVSNSVTLGTLTQSQTQGTLTCAGTALYALTVQTQDVALGAVSASTQSDGTYNLTVQSQDQNLNPLSFSGTASMALSGLVQTSTLGAAVVSGSAQRALGTLSQAQALGDILAVVGRLRAPHWWIGQGSGGLEIGSERSGELVPRSEKSGSL